MLRSTAARALQVLFRHRRSACTVVLPPGAVALSPNDGSTDPRVAAATPGTPHNIVIRRWALMAHLPRSSLMRRRQASKESRDDARVDGRQRQGTWSGRRPAAAAGAGAAGGQTG